MQTKKIGTSGGLIPDIPNQLVSAAILAHYSQSSNNKQKKEARRPLFLSESVRLILTEVPLAVNVVKVKLAK